MSIKRSPLKTDPRGKCSRRHVCIYNRDTKKEEWRTVHGPRSVAVQLERDFEEQKEDGTYVSVTRDEIARRFDSTPERITQLICYERSKRRPRMEKSC